MDTLDKESFVLSCYRSVPFYKFHYFGRFLSCLRIALLTKSYLFSKTWFDSSSKKLPPPDFHNEKYGLLLEIMRIDDCSNSLNGISIQNSFERANVKIKKYFGHNYKNSGKGSLIFVSDTRNNNEFNFRSYFDNFKRVLMKHSEKIDKYKQNYPKCKTTILLICDESNNYVEVLDKNDLNRKLPLGKWRVHGWFLDEAFLKVIKETKADYIIWYGFYKSIYRNKKEMKLPSVCIFDVKHFKENGFKYNHDMMFKVTEEIKPK